MANHSNLLIVEGKNDFHVMLALRDKLQMKTIYGVDQKENDDQLLKSIPAELNVSGRKCLGIILDADPDSNRWEQLKGTLSTRGYDMTDEASPSGSILPSPELGLPKVGIWLMPDNQKAGMLEDFMQLLIPENDECLVFAEETLQALEEKEIQRYKEVHRSKALIHTWIAWQDQPGIPLGQSTTRYLDINTELCQKFADWLNRLFSDKEEKTGSAN
ncbi:MAG: DUF3226 domain-containing protein [Bacteroidota bacterium]